MILGPLLAAATVSRAKGEASDTIVTVPASAAASAIAHCPWAWKIPSPPIGAVSTGSARSSPRKVVLTSDASMPLR